MNIREMVKHLNPVLRSWATYFRVANCKVYVRSIDGVDTEKTADEADAGMEELEATA